MTKLINGGVVRMGVVLPGWADEILDIIGISWPNVDEDDYRDMADAMREFADDFDGGANEAHQAIQGLVSSAGGSLAVEALNAHWSKINGTHLKNLGECGRLAATALDGVAILIEGAKIGAIVQLGILAAEVIAAQAAAPFTFGLSELGALAGTQATRLAVRRIFKEVCQQVAEQVISIALTPIEEALGAMVGDLVVQLGANALGVQDGIDVGHAAQAGKEGFSQGLQGAKDSAKSAAANPMQLLSAGGSSGGAGGGAGGSGGFKFDEGEHDRVVTGLDGAAGTFRNKAGGKIGRAKSHHGRTRGKDAIADAANAMLDKVIDGIEDGVKKTAKHLGDNMTRGVKQMAKNHRDNDNGLADHFKGIGKNGNKDPKAPHTNGLSSPWKGNDRGANSKARQQLDKEHPNNNSRVDLTKKGCGDPVDVATGRVYLREVDVALPGSMPLTFSRKFESSCSVGRTIGPSWTSTVDQRLEFDEQGVIFVTEDGMLLAYPLPRAGQQVLPLRGPRWPLAVTEQGDWSIHDPGSGYTRYFAPVSHTSGIALLDEITDRNGNHITFDYDNETGAPLAIRHSAGYHLKFTTDEHGLLTTLQLAAAGEDGTDLVLTTYEHDESGNLTAVSNSSGLPNGYEYDDQHRMTAWIDTNGSRYEYTYDPHGRCVAQGGSEGHLRYRYAYEPVDPATGHRVVAVTDSMDHVSRYKINERLQVVAETNPLGHTTSTRYDNYDRVLSVTDALGHTTRYERDQHGHLTTAHLPDGTQTHATYNDLGLPTQITEADGQTWRYSYDERGNRLTQTDPTGATIHCTYNSAGHLIAVTDPRGEATRLVSNAAGLVIAVTDPSGTNTSCVRDEFGRIVQATDAAGAVVHQGWNIEGQPTWRQLADGTRESWEWDAEGNLTSYTDRIGRTTTFAVDAFDQLSSTAAPGNSQYRFGHDTELRLTTITGPDGRSWQYHYDPAGRLAAETDFDGHVMTYQHDAAGRITAQTNRTGQTLHYERDVLGRVVRLTSEDGTTDSLFQYGPSGVITQASNADAQITVTHSPAGQPVQETVNGQRLTREFDAMGRLTGRHTPLGSVSRWAFDTADDVSSYQVADHHLRFTHDLFGCETRRILDDILSVDHAWDVNGHITHQVVRTSGATHERRYSYGRDGSPLSLRDHVTGQRAISRDGAGRIVAVQADRGDEQYEYTATGDQSSATWPSYLPGQAAVGERVYRGSLISRAGRTHYRHDEQGRLLTRQRTSLSGKTSTWRYKWNAEDRLTAVTTPKGLTWRYRYDPLGRRIAKQCYDSHGRMTEETVFTWDGHLLVEESLRCPDNPTLQVTTWDYLGDRPITQTERTVDARDGRETARQFFLVVTSPNGTPTELVDESGSIAWKADSTLWGLTAWDRSSTAYTPLRFPGQYFDRETGLHYNFNRYYDPETGRYLSPDPLGLVPAPNPYTYVEDPLAHTDPLGLAKKCRDDITWGGRVEWGRDRHGRLETMRARVERDMIGEGTSARSDLLPPGFTGQSAGQARGHMLAAMLGGTGDKLTNLFAITHRPVNTPDMRAYEFAVRRAVREEGSIHYNVRLEYDNDAAKIPRYIHLEARGRGGPIFQNVKLENPAWLQEP
ncbi:RHS repeat-associated core domain-containing protein [Streptomyces sioyaensis]|uniref:RHS repeat-associated core domain-containing protein n=1 Tax=Streptomyces sioyaensis TaxID=67364 RepID=UPI003D7572A8